MQHTHIHTQWMREGVFVGQPVVHGAERSLGPHGGPNDSGSGGWMGGGCGGRSGWLAEGHHGSSQAQRWPGHGGNSLGSWAGVGGPLGLGRPRSTPLIRPGEIASRGCTRGSEPYGRGSKWFLKGREKVERRRELGRLPAKWPGKGMRERDR